jgi:3-methylcrotonyl-CoA carboxylase alpha subunit
MFSKILIANRGEIACRIIATARRMGVATVAVFSEADAQARHVELADEAYPIGPAPARQSYLRGDVILQVARRSGAQAIHPGYGFLSENADFAQASADAGVVFIGPPVAAIRAMGSKAAAKELMQRSNVPLVPGYHGADQSLAVLQAEAGRIGYPVLLKASAGGGGRGMRVVERAADLADSVDRAKGEARASFGDDHLLVEKYLTRPRHIEVQVFGDSHGKIVSLFERDCSVQRRHQKVLEESPAPSITPAQRRALGAAAIAAARAVDYVGAGTVEFIYEDDRFYFMEMNTRLQVEHPVTEFVTGQDLVEWQLRVAAGETLPATQAELAIHGHAIEARICAEDPERDFMPATGRVSYLRQPPASAHVRVDTGIREGDVITPSYDSMIAKLIVWDADRASALRQMARALDAYHLIGPRTNLDLLRRIVRHADFAAGDFDTGFIGRHPEVIEGDHHPAPAIWAAACLAVLTPGDAAPADPWAESDGWRLNGVATAAVTLEHAEAHVTIEVRSDGNGFWRLDLPDGVVLARLHLTGEDARLELDGARLKLSIVRHNASITVIREGRNHGFTLVDPLAPPEAEAIGDAKLTAPTPARVVSVFVGAGDAVTKGQRLLILEAMKVETTFSAPRDGVIAAVHVRADDLVQEGHELVSFQVEPG